MTTDPLVQRSPLPAPIARTAESPLARPGEFARTAWRDLRRSRTLARALFARQLRAQQRRSFAAFAALILPVVVVTAAGLGFQSAGVLRADTGGMPAGLFVLTGVILWMTFLDAIHAPMYGLTGEQRLFARTNAPLEAVVLATLGVVAVHAGLRLALLVPAAPWLGQALPATMALAPLAAAGLIVLGAAVGLVLAPINLVYRDVPRLLLAVTSLWLFLSPVFYPAPVDGTLGLLMRLNPVTPLMTSARGLAVTGDVAVADAAAAAIGAVALLALSWIYVRVAWPIALERGGD